MTSGFNADTKWSSLACGKKDINNCGVGDPPCGKVGNLCQPYFDINDESDGISNICPLPKNRSCGDGSGMGVVAAYAIASPALFEDPKCLYQVYNYNEEMKHSLLSGEDFHHLWKGCPSKGSGDFSICPKPKVCPACPKTKVCPICPKTKVCPACPKTKVCPTCRSCPSAHSDSSLFLGITVAGLVLIAIFLLFSKMK